MLTPTKINRDEAHTFFESPPGLVHDSVSPFVSLFSSLKIGKCSVFVRQRRLEQFDSLTAPNSFVEQRVHCKADMSKTQMSLKVWPLGAVKIHYLSVYTLSPPPEINQFLPPSFIRSIHTGNQTRLCHIQEMGGCQWDEP